MEFEEFARRHVHDLIRLGQAMTGSQHDAEDFAQAALERIFQNWETVNRATNSWAYARRTAVNVFLADRRRSRVLEVLTDRSDLPQPTLLPPDSSWGDGQIEHAISRLPRQQRAVLVLRYLEDLDTDEIARVLDIEASTVRSNLARALAAIRHADSLSTKGPSR